MTKPHKCSRCRLLRRGHVGPSGSKCKMSLKGGADTDSFMAPAKRVNTHADSPDANGENLAKPTQPPKIKQASPVLDGPTQSVEPFLSELAAQLGQLTLSMQELTQENHSMRIDIAQCKSASRSFPAECAPSQPLPRSCDDLYSSRHDQREMLPLDNHDAHFPGYSNRYQPTNPDTPVSLMNGARVMKKLVLSAKAGEYADLLHFVPNNNPVTL
jgi:hypothetical protein